MFFKKRARIIKTCFTILKLRPKYDLKQYNRDLDGPLFFKSIIKTL